jgi:uncharacterized protein YejL (UPF0352 family)
VTDVFAETTTAVVTVLARRKLKVREALSVIGAVATALVRNLPKDEQEEMATDFCRILHEAVSHEEIRH